VNTKKFLRPGLSLGQVACLATRFMAKFILGDGGNSQIKTQL